MREIVAFWAWWADNRDRVLAQIHSGAEADFIGELSDLVAAISEELDWEFGPGERAQHHLCLSARGDPRLRVLVERWRAAGPEDDADFEFHCARQRMAQLPEDAAIAWGDLEVDIGGFRYDIEVVDHAQRFAITVHHAVFAAVDDDLRHRILFVTLDNILGEDAVELWLAGIEASTDPPPDDAVGANALRRLIDGAPDRWPDETWAVLQGQVPDTGQPLIVVGCTSAKYLLAPLFDTLCLARLPYEADDNGMPATAEEKHRVDSFDEAVDELEGVRALCHATGGGQRTAWYYLTAENGPERSAIERIAAEHPGRVELSFTWDPGWRALPI